MSALWAMVCVSWRRILRDRLAVMTTFMLPIAVAVVLAGVYTAQGSRPSLGVLSQSDSPVARDVVRGIETSGVFDIHRFEDRDELDRAVRERRVAAGVVVPPDVATPGAEIDLVGPPQTAAPGGIRAAVEAAVADTAAALQVGRALAPEGPVSVMLQQGHEALGPAPATSDQADRAAGRSGAVAWALIAALVMFVFLNTMAMSAGLPDLRELGILARARTAAVAPSVIAAGFGLMLATYALAVATLMLLSGWLVFGITWESLPSLGLALVLLAGAAGGLGLAVGSFLPAAELGPSVVAPAGFALGAVGGCLWPLEIVGPTLSAVGHLTPHAWALEALRATGVDGDGVSAVWPQLAVLAATAGLTLAVGCRRTWRMIVRS